MFAFVRPQSDEFVGWFGGLPIKAFMQGPQMPLTDAAIRVFKPSDKEYKVTDEKGLYLLVTPAGGKLWKQNSGLGARWRRSFRSGATQMSV